MHGPDATHEHLRDEYKTLLSNAFGAAEAEWPAASPAHFDPADIAGRVRAGAAPRLIAVDQSAEDRLVPMNQQDKLVANLRNVSGLQVVEGHRCPGKHAAPWQQGVPIWDSVQDVLTILQESA